MMEVDVSKKKEKKVLIVIITILLLVAIGAGVYYFVVYKNKDNNEVGKEVENVEIKSQYRLSSNGLEPFDLYFLQLENQHANKVYSPLSIKYALAMLNEGTSGDTKKQITSIIGDYNTKKYTNSKNMSFANALFVKDSYKDNIKETYVNNLKTKYNAEVIYDSFSSPYYINNWISNNTFNLINNVFDDLSDIDFALVNALAIDMEWDNVLQPIYGDYEINYQHEKYNFYIPCLNEIDSEISRLNYFELDFNNSSKVNSVKIGAVINKYDIVNILGEENIRKTVSEAYEKWKAENPNELIDDFDLYLDNYINNIDRHYGNVSSSTDFEFFIDEDIKVFAKDLKEYDGTTLQYIGIMPKEESLDNYINDLTINDINYLINNLKTIEFDNLKEGVITEISGYIPMLKFEYELKLMQDLQKLGITNVFDENKADLSNLTSSDAYITDAKHKSNIEFSNEGIKASSATFIGGAGNIVGGFDYIYDVPVEKIDLTFDKPYMFLIRDKESNEIWFMGTVYEPYEYISITEE